MSMSLIAEQACNLYATNHPSANADHLAEFFDLASDLLVIWDDLLSPSERSPLEGTVDNLIKFTYQQTLAWVTCFNSLPAKIAYLEARVNSISLLFERPQDVCCSDFDVHFM